MRLHKTGHHIADTVSDLIGELPDGDYKIAYGILRHKQFTGHSWFEMDKGFWGADHYSGSYRISYRSTQPEYRPDFPIEKPHNLTLEPWRTTGGYTLICPPTSHVCEFFGVDDIQWSFRAANQAGSNFKFRYKGDPAPIEWDKIGQLITFNSTLGVEALRRGIPVISDPVHSSVGSYTAHINQLDGFDRDPLFSFLDGHQFRLHERERIAWLVKYYLSKHCESLSATTHERPSPPMSASTQSPAAQNTPQK